MKISTKIQILGITVILLGISGWLNLNKDTSQDEQIKNLNKLVNSQDERLDEYKEWASIVNKTNQNIVERLKLLDYATEEQHKMLLDVYDMCKLIPPETEPTAVEPALEYEPGDDDIVPGVY